MTETRPVRTGGGPVFTKVSGAERIDPQQGFWAANRSVGTSSGATDSSSNSTNSSQTAGGTARSGAPTPVSEPDEALSTNDPCFERLQDLGGALLTYFVLHRELPSRLSLLVNERIVNAAEIVCPGSSRPYSYNPFGEFEVQFQSDPRFALAPQQGKAIAFDDGPVHAGHRWVLIYLEPNGRTQATMNVIAAKESSFTKR